MTKRSLTLVTCFICSTAFAIGGDNTHNQGVSLAGRGFDDSLTLRPAQTVPSFDNNKGWPPTGPYPAGVDQGSLKIQVTCPKGKDRTPIDQTFALCTAEMHLLDKLGKPAPVCDLDDSSKGTVSLLAIRGTWSNDGHLVLAKDKVTFACAPTFEDGSIKTVGDFWRRMEHVRDPKVNSKASELAPGLRGPVVKRVKSTIAGTNVEIGATLSSTLTVLDLSNIESSLNLGVLAKCYFWGFAKSGEGERDPELKTYQACVKAARADYCGNGQSQTMPGTLIQIYETPETRDGTPRKVGLDRASCILPYVKPDLCFEAIWDENRAVCVSHARYEEMPPGDCNKAAMFPNQVKVPDADGGVTNNVDDTAHCAITNYLEAAAQSRVKNRSRINRLNGGVRLCTSEIRCP